MEALAELTTQLMPALTGFMLALARLSPIIFLIPGIGEQFLSVRSKLLVLLALSASLVSTGVVPVIPIEPFGPFVLAMLVEIITGLKMGVLLRALTWILTIAGNVIANMIGLSQLVGVASHSDSQTVLANMLSLAGTALLLTMNFHVMVFAEVVKSYDAGLPGFDASLDVPELVAGLARAFNFAIILAWPFVAVSLIYNLCLGFINRAMPQLMVAFVGAPFMIGSGFILLVASISGILLVWKDRAFSVLGLI